MGLLSIFQRRSDSAADNAPSAEPDAVVAARTRARRRLIGAAVLLGIGVVGFPLLFESQPRPVPVNIPIEIPRKDSAVPLAPPGGGPALSAASAAVVLPDSAPPTEAEPSTRPAAKPAEITERAADAGREVTLPVPPVLAPAEAAAAAAPKPAPSASRPAPTADDGSRAQALLNGNAASAAGVRMVVQVGAYTEPDKLREARQKVEQLGFKTYTQVVQVEGSKRTRVRIGPFATRAEADRAAARVKAAILTL